MTRTLAALALGVAALLSAPRDAAAWTNFHNAYSNTIWAAHAFDSTQGFLCGYSDGCSGNGFRLVGWFKIAPGGTMTVDSRGWGNAKHYAYAEDGLGHFWVGGGGTGDEFTVPDTAFNACEYDNALTEQPTSNIYFFFLARGTSCCGGSCPGNGTVNFNP